MRFTCLPVCTTYSAYLIYNPDSDASASNPMKLGEALLNALVIVLFFGIATFVIVACYKFNFNRVCHCHCIALHQNEPTDLRATPDADLVHDVLVWHVAGAAGRQHGRYCDRAIGLARGYRVVSAGDVQLCCGRRRCCVLSARGSGVARSDVLDRHVGDHGLATGAVSRVEHMGLGRDARVLRSLRCVVSMRTTEVARAYGAAGRPTVARLVQWGGV